MKEAASRRGGKGKQPTKKVEIRSEAGSDSSDCSCDSCLEIMAEAYNEYLKEVESTQAHSHLQHPDVGKENNQSHGNHRRNSQAERHAITAFDRYGSGTKSNVRLNESEYSHASQQPYTEEEIRRMMQRVNDRIQRNLQKHRELAESEKEQKQRLMHKVKEELERLRYRSRIELEKAKKKPVDLAKLKVWNYQPLVKAKPKGEDKEEEPKPEEKLKAETNTGRINYELLGEYRFLNEMRKRVKQEYSKRRHHINKHAKCTFDDCDKHHLKTPAEEIEKINKKIDRRAEEYLNNQKQLKQEEEKKEKLKEAKLRGLALEAKRKLDQSKKQTVDAERSSFNLSIQEFSTFSHMRENNDLKKKELLLRQLEEKAEKIDMKQTPRNQQRQEAHHIEEEEFENVLAQQAHLSTGPAGKKKVGKKVQPENVRQQELKKMKESLAEDKPTRKVVSGLPPTDIHQNTDKFYQWKLPLEEERMKTLFEQAKLVRPPNAKLNRPDQTQAEDEPVQKKAVKGQKQSQDQNKKKKADFREQKLNEKKDQLVRQYSGVTETIQSRIEPIEQPPQAERPTRKNRNGEIKQKFMQKLKSKERRPAYPEPADHTANRDHPSNHHYETYCKLGDTDTLAQGKLAVHDPIMQKHEMDQQRHNPAHLLLDNDFLSEEDKKVFILNYRLLTKVPRLVI